MDILLKTKEEKPSPLLLDMAVEACRADLAENVKPGDINILIPDNKSQIVLRGRQVIEVLSLTLVHK
jgi:hypothetical protein